MSDEQVKAFSGVETSSITLHGNQEVRIQETKRTGTWGDYWVTKIQISGYDGNWMELTVFPEAGERTVFNHLPDIDKTENCK